MKVSQLPYERVTIEYIRSAIESIFADIKSAASADDVLAARKRYVDLTTEIETMLSLAYCRHTLDTRDQFYTDEQNYYDEITPELTQIITEYGRLMLESPFRAELEQRLSPVLFKSFEVAQKAMSPKTSAEKAFSPLIYPQCLQAQNTEVNLRKGLKPPLMKL